MSLKDRSSSCRQAEIASHCHVPVSAQHRAPECCMACATACRLLLMQGQCTADRVRTASPRQLLCQAGQKGQGGKYKHMEISARLKQLSMDKQKKLPCRKCYGFKLAETCWWMMSKVLDCNWYLDVYEKTTSSQHPEVQPREATAFQASQA